MAISTYDALLGDLRTQIPAIEVDELANSLATQTVIDCREADEHAAGAIPGAAGLRAAQQLRYARHLAIPEVGEAGQQKLLAAKIACIGAGGLGSPVALYL